MMPAMILVVAASVTVASPETAIQAVLADSAAGWNAGDLARFTAIYAPDATYASGKEIARGREAIAARYAKSFADGGNTRGRLGFEPVAWRLLSQMHMLLVARWTLTPASGVPRTGLTTLLFERRKEGWRIIADHSS